ncbi:MAG TPA: thioredoxin family protein [Thermoanaerobaculia bacterium]|nr:thioredoxin family protein [Thermoanaerobaculia bacterium]
MKRGTILPCALIALAVGSGCRGREDGASPASAPLDPSKKPLSSSSLPFASLSFDEALEKARAEKRLVFVDVYADWCTWCTKMDEDVFVDPRVQKALLDFVPIKVDTDKSGGRAVANRYRVAGLPAYLVVNGDGELVGRFDGYLPVEAFLLRLRAASGSRG